MELWQDQGIVLSARPHGESGAIVSILTENYGRSAGYIRGAQSSRQRGIIEPGSLVGARWSARSEGQLGTFTLEQDRNMAAGIMDDPLPLAAMLSACALCDAALPEREAHPGLFHGMIALMESLGTDIWGAAYIMWEIALMRELGFALDLSRCAANGDPMTIEWVSPKSGHAVSLAAGEPYKDKLLPLPAFLKPVRGGADDEEVMKGLRMTSYFLEHWIFNHHTKGIPEQRLRFQERFARHIGDVTISESNGTQG
ncbi:MAG TPA: DNA repair protein RecO [Alphaproteobacteria bacterium]